jgi:CubicO group peptidase (beta-lactamase class C family)
MRLLPLASAGFAQLPIVAIIALGSAVTGTSARGEEDVSALLETIREKRDVPALAAAVVKSGEITAAGATGLRRLGGTKKVTTDDKWHIGSCTKSMTASVAAMLVERRALRWEQTIGETLGQRCPDMHRDWKAVTLDQLLRHRAGAPPEAPPELWAKARAQRGTPSDQRWAFVRGILAVPPPIPPGTKFAYSNQGYSIAGQMLEVAGKRPWEEMMRELLFKPLDLKTAGFGAPGDARLEDQPWGHQNKTPVPPGPMADNPPAIGPSGTVHLSIKDFARYAGWHASQNKFLPAAQFARLHTPLPEQDYAMGWHATERPWGGGTVYTHNGSNTVNYAVMWVAPARNFAVVAATNAAGANAEGACDDACAQLIGKFLKEQ